MTCVLLMEQTPVACFQCLQALKNHFLASKVLVIQVLIVFNAIDKGAFDTSVKRTGVRQRISIANVSSW